jgi:hypothetical protein
MVVSLALLIGVDHLWLGGAIFENSIWVAARWTIVVCGLALGGVAYLRPSP